MDDPQYYKAVVDVCRLIAHWTTLDDAADPHEALITLEQKMAEKLGPVSSFLSTQIGLNEKLGLREPDPYWQGVEDTVSLVRNFVEWRRHSETGRALSNFLSEIISKAQAKVEPPKSPLLGKLGLDFSQEYQSFEPPQGSFSLPESSPVRSEAEPSLREFIPERPPAPSHTEARPTGSPIEGDFFAREEDILSEELVDPAEEPVGMGDPSPVTTSFPDLGQPASPPVEVSNPESPPSSSNSFSESSFLRSALEELNRPVSNDSEEELEESWDSEENIQWTFVDHQPKESKPEPVEPVIDRGFPSLDVSSLDDNTDGGFGDGGDGDDNDEDEQLSSSLRDALRLLREED